MNYLLTTQQCDEQKGEEAHVGSNPFRSNFINQIRHISANQFVYFFLFIPSTSIVFKFIEIDGNGALAWLALSVQCNLYELYSLLNEFAFIIFAYIDTVICVYNRAIYFRLRNEEKKNI